MCLYYHAETKRTTKSSIVEMLQEKYARKAALKEKELDLKKMELELEKKKLELDEMERKKRLEMEEDRQKLEAEERRAILDLLRKNM